MSQIISCHDALAPATAALAAARRLRARLSTATFQLPIGAFSRITQILDGFDGSGGFTDAFLRDLGETITWCERAVAAGTRTDYETYDAWDREGRETTVFHPIQLLTPQARQLNSLVVDLKQLASLIERTIDLVAANAIVVSLAPGAATCRPARGAANERGSGALSGVRHVDVSAPSGASARCAAARTPALEENPDMTAMPLLAERKEAPPADDELRTLPRETQGLRTSEGAFSRPVAEPAAPAFVVSVHGGGGVFGVGEVAIGVCG